MNCWNSSLVEVVAGVPLGLTGCSGLLGPTVLGRTFLRERKPRTISAERNLTELLQTGWLTRWVWSN